jgi:hypothetical protein
LEGSGRVLFQVTVPAAAWETVIGWESAGAAGFLDKGNSILSIMFGYLAYSDGVVRGK